MGAPCGLDRDTSSVNSILTITRDSQPGPFECHDENEKHAAGKNLPHEDRNRLEAARNALRDLYKRPRKAA